MKTRWLLIFLCGLISFSTMAQAQEFSDMSEAALNKRAANDVALLKRYQAEVRRLQREMKENEVLFENKAGTLSAEERKKVFEIFSGVLEYNIALDELMKFHGNFWRLGRKRHRQRHAQHFALSFAAHAQRVALGLSFVERTLDKPQFERLLDEGNSPLGIPPRLFAKLKFTVVNVGETARLAAAHQYHESLRKKAYDLSKSPVTRYAVASADTTWEALGSKILRTNPKMLSKNGLDILKDAGQFAWLPVQTRVAEFMGDTKFRRREGETLIDEALIRAASKRAKPGDVIIERRNWYLSNVGLPGFWPHAALYLGSPKELADTFDSDEKTTLHYGMPFSKYLAQRYKAAWKSYTSKDEGHLRRLVEAVSEGVIFSTPEHSFAADYVGALRPRLSTYEKARAIERAFSYAFRPYDFNFDWYTDETLVCSELVYKAFEKRGSVSGLQFELTSLLGRMTLSPNNIVAQWASAKVNRQFDFVFFIDSSEKEKRSFFSDEKSFRASYLRPKWDISQQ